MKQDNQMDPYEEHIKELRAEWVGKKVWFGKKKAEIVDVTFDGFLVASTPTLRDKKRKNFVLPEYVQIVKE